MYWVIKLKDKRPNRKLLQSLSNNQKVTKPEFGKWQWKDKPKLVILPVPMKMIIDIVIITADCNQMLNT